MGNPYVRISSLIFLSIFSLSIWLAAPSTAWANPSFVDTGSEPGLWSQFVTWVYVEQAAFHRALTKALRLLRDGGGSGAAWTLIGASFLYGVFHAAGPGHGKVVLTTYLATQPEKTKQALILSVMAALCQGVSAIAIVYGLVYVAGWLPRDTKIAVTWGERASFTLVALLGIWLVIRAARSIWRKRINSPDHSHALSDLQPVHHHHHDSSCGHGEHGEHGEHGAGCGHTHAIGAKHLAEATDLRTRLGLILSIGMRPCTGAILVLVFAQIAHLQLAGFASVVAMSLGTALAVACLAMLTITARRWAVRLTHYFDATERGPKGLKTIMAYSGDIIGFLGGVLIIFFGVSLVLSSLQPAHPLGL